MKDGHGKRAFAIRGAALGIVRSPAKEYKTRVLICRLNVNSGRWRSA